MKENVMKAIENFHKFGSWPKGTNVSFTA